MQRGIFITFEGGEGCGKSSHIKSLAELFEKIGRKCAVSREPGGTPLSEKIRALLLEKNGGVKMSPRTEILLFEAARAQHVDEFIKPALDNGCVVLCDRFFDSTTAYQGAARRLDADTVQSLNNFAAAGLKPDLTVILDLPAEDGLARANSRDNGNADRMGSEKTEFYEAVRAAFLKLAMSDPSRFAVVDSSKPKEETFKKILEELKRRGIL